MPAVRQCLLMFRLSAAARTPAPGRALTVRHKSPSPRPTRSGARGLRGASTRVSSSFATAAASLRGVELVHEVPPEAELDAIVAERESVGKVLSLAPLKLAAHHHVGNRVVEQVG